MLVLWGRTANSESQSLGWKRYIAEGFGMCQCNEMDICVALFSKDTENKTSAYDETLTDQFRSLV